MSFDNTALEHAVVIGGSMAGLLAARVLADHYQRVTLIERDVFPGVGENRKGVPHGRHVHGLHPRGREILDELFPGFTDAVAAAGGVRCDALANLRYQVWGHQFVQAPIGLPALFASRPFLEGSVRERVRALPQVTVLDGHSVASLTATADRRRITGVKVDGPGGTSEVIAADLVVDASGRGSRTGLWLTDLGYQPPVEERIEIGVGYSTRSYRLRPDAVDGDALILTAGTPANPRTGVLAAAEGGKHMVTLAGICGDHPPTDPAVTLRRVLKAGTIDQPRRYFKAIARTIDNPWDIAVGGDLAFPAVAGKRTAKVRMINAYLPRVCAAAERDEVLAKVLAMVFGLKAKPQGIMRPDRMVRVLRGWVVLR